MNKFEAIIAERQAAERRQAEAWRTVALLDALPEDLDFKLVHARAHRCDGGLDIEIVDRLGVAPLVAKLPPVPAVRLKNTFLSFLAAEAVTAKERDDVRIDIRPICPVIFAADDAGGWKRRAFEWWTRVGEHLLKVKAEVRGDLYDLFRFVDAHARDHRGRVLHQGWQVETRLPATDRHLDLYAGAGTETGKAVVWWEATTDVPALLNRLEETVSPATR